MVNILSHEISADADLVREKTNSIKTFGYILAVFGHHEWRSWWQGVTEREAENEGGESEDDDDDDDDNDVVRLFTLTEKPRVLVAW